jgi:hypothetical protein
MSIFSRIKDAIFGHDKPGAAPKPSPTAPPRTMREGGVASPTDARWERPEPAHVDIEQVLTDLAAKNPQKLNWRTSIVDLMKLVGIDSSIENRKELARELGYTGDTQDSASMNIWLHKRVMQELEKNGGKVPAALVA